jgi:CRP/FNR family cyclic AMP-dependent transcriptional regulator
MLVALPGCEPRDADRSSRELPKAEGPVRIGHVSKVDELKRVPLFSPLSQRQLGRLARQVGEREFAPGTSIVLEGQKNAVSFFIVAEGEASVTIGGKHVRTLGPGDHFGELALITERERNATVTATTPLRCLIIPFWNFRSFALENPDVTWKLLKHVVDLLLAADTASSGAR